MKQNSTDEKAGSLKSLLPRLLWIGIAPRYPRRIKLAMEHLLFAGWGFQIRIAHGV